MPAPYLLASRVSLLLIATIGVELETIQNPVALVVVLMLTSVVYMAWAYRRDRRAMPSKFRKMNIFQALDQIDYQ